MRKQTIGLIVVGLVMLSAPAVFAQKEQPRRLYTYVTQFQVPRAQWAQFAEETEKIADPLFERLMAEGTIVSWGDFEAVVHTPDGMTHGSWWQATSFAGTMRVLDELRKAGPRHAQNIATKHEDALMHTNVIFAVPHSVTTGYMHVFATHCQPGKGDDYVALLKKYFQTAVEEEMIKKGAATYWAADEDYIPSRDTSMRYMISIFVDAEALDKWAAVQASVLQKMSPEDRKAWEDGNANTMVRDSPRSFHYLMRITHYAHK